MEANSKDFLLSKPLVVPANVATRPEICMTLPKNGKNFEQPVRETRKTNPVSPLVDGQVGKKVWLVEWSYLVKHELTFDLLEHS